MDNINAKLVEKAAGIFPKLYDDGAKPAIKETGKTIALLPRAINAALAPLEKWILQKEYNIEETKKLLEKKLENIDENEIVSPEPYIAVPALQAISYTMDSDELRNLYANLLASSMVSSTKSNSHPSFVEIIKQLSPDEAKLLKTINNGKRRSFPLIDLRIQDINRGSYQTVVRNFTLIAKGVCEMPQNTSSYLDNLARLKLIDVNDMVYLTDDNVYKKLEDSEELNEYKKRYSLQKNQKWEIQKKTFDITNFGRIFINTCVIDKEENQN